MAPADGALAERVHATVTATAPELSPKTWYGMPAYAKYDGQVVVFFQDSGQFSYRSSSLGVPAAAPPHDGRLGAASCAARTETRGAERAGGERNGKRARATSWPAKRPNGGKRKRFVG